jgi:hypothetical protein
MEGSPRWECEVGIENASSDRCAKCPSAEKDEKSVLRDVSNDRDRRVRWVLFRKRIRWCTIMQPPTSRSLA